MATITKRRNSKGAIRYQAIIRIKKKGKVIYSESKTFSKQSLAKSWAKKREETLEDPQALLSVQHRGVTVGELIKKYIKEVEEIKSFGRSKSSALSFLQEQDIADLDAIEVNSKDIMQHINQRRREGATAATAEQDIVWLRVVFKYARRAWKIPVPVQEIQDASDALRDHKIIAKPKRRKRRPTYEELKKLDAHFASRKRSTIPMQLIMWFAIYSARRQDEITRIKKDDLDKKHGTGWLRDIKHPDGSEGNDKEFVLPERGWKIIEEIKKLNLEGDELLPFNSKTIGSYFTRACHMLGIEDLRFHDLRHEACSRLAEDGYTIPRIQQVSLHDSWSSLQIYVNMPTKKQKRLDFKPR